MSIRRHELADDQWNLIEPLFPKYQTGRPAKHYSATAKKGGLIPKKTLLEAVGAASIPRSTR